MDVIISLGGSLIVPDSIDIAFLKKFRQLVLKEIKKGKRFIIICGGGKISRNYQNAAKEITDITRDDIDWLGIHATRLNAHLLRTIFRDVALEKIIKNPESDFEMKSVVIAAGWKPGFSTDYDAVMLAKKTKAKLVINLTDLYYVHDKDPKKFPDAKPFKSLTWEDFRHIVGNKWDPGLNLPFDPIASKLAEELGLKVIITKGNDLENLENILEGRKFKGSVIT
jgi:uridylate kinase